MDLIEFLNQRQTPRRAFGQFYPVPGAQHTVMVASHIWWTECIAHSIMSLGFNVLVVDPCYLLYTDDRTWTNFEIAFDRLIAQAKLFGVRLIIGGNTSAMVIHPETGEMLHQALGVPIVHYWWDEPRIAPPMHRRGVSLSRYMRALHDPTTLNVIWDIDVCESMRDYFGLSNTLHAPLATPPELWPTRPTPLRQRVTPVSFLGNCHGAVSEADLDDGVVDLSLVRAVARTKARHPFASMRECLRMAMHAETQPAPATANTGDARSASSAGDADMPPAFDRLGAAVHGEVMKEVDLSRAFANWSAVAALLNTYRRNDYVAAAAEHLGDRLELIGKGWQRLSLHASAENSGIPGAGYRYADAKASLNLFGGCVHAGMPLRIYDIAASGGLIVTAANRELPHLFEPERECVVFEDAAGLCEQVDRVLRAPHEFDAVWRAGQRRAKREHSWRRRMGDVLAYVGERFDLPWSRKATPPVIVRAKAPAMNQADADVDATPLDKPATSSAGAPAQPAQPGPNAASPQHAPAQSSNET